MMLTDLIDDIQGVLLQKLDNTTLIMLCNANKKYHQLVSYYGKINKFNRKLYCSTIASMGYLEVLKWARENGHGWNTNTCYLAAKHGRLEVLKWAQENGCNWDHNTCSYAAYNGHLEVLKWARENGCDWNFYTCYHAAYKGHLEVLKWARENGCEWDFNTEQIAKQKWPEIFQ
jgi:hypothetical protein